MKLKIIKALTMKTKKIIFLLYAVIILLVPIYLVVKSEGILTNGTLYKFKPQAYDPFDPFRGKFLRVNYDTEGIKSDEDIEEGDRVYVSIGIDNEGYAFFDKAYKNPPSEGDYLHTIVTYVYYNDYEYIQEEGASSLEMGIEIPDHMNKYFINENKALDAENVFRWKREEIYIGVRILNGEARIQDIYVEGQPLLIFLDENDIEYEEMMIEEMMCEGGCEGGEKCEEAACESGDTCESGCEGGEACEGGNVCETPCEGGEVVPAPAIEEVIEYEEDVEEEVEKVF